MPNNIPDNNALAKQPPHEQAGPGIAQHPHVRITSTTNSTQKLQRRSTTMMPSPLMPLGYIEESTDGGGTFVLARPTDREQFSTGTPVLIRNEHQNGDAVALLRGYITEAAGTTAAFIITHTEIDPHWPIHIDPKGTGNPIYLALQDAFHPDFSRGYASTEEASYLMECALKHQQDTGIEPRGAVYVPLLVHQDDPHAGPIED